MNKQTKLHSLAEAINTALVSVPTAFLLHKVLLMIAGEHALNESQDLFIIITTVCFFIHSVTWKYIIRRIYEKFGVRLDPLYIIAKVRKK